LSLEAAIENQQASDKAKSIESDPIDLALSLRRTTWSLCAILTTMG